MNAENTQTELKPCPECGKMDTSTHIPILDCIHVDATPTPTGELAEIVKRHNAVDCHQTHLTSDEAHADIGWLINALIEALKLNSPDLSTNSVRVDLDMYQALTEQLTAFEARVKELREALDDLWLYAPILGGPVSCRICYAKHPVNDIDNFKHKPTCILADTTEGAK